MSEIQRPKAVAFVVPGWPRQEFPNGIVSYTTHMRAELRRQGIRVFVLAHKMTAPTKDEDVVSVQPSTSNRGVINGYVERIGRRLAPAYTVARRHSSTIVRETQRLQREFGLELVQMEESFGWPRMVVPRCPVPTVVRLHGPWFLVGVAAGRADKPDSIHRVHCEGKGIAMAAGISTASQVVLERVREHYGLALENAVVIPNAITPMPADDRWSPSNCEPDRILFIGRFDRIKGGDLVIDGFRHLLSMRPQCRLTFVGPDRGFQDDSGQIHQIKPFIEDRLPGALADGRIEWLDFQHSDSLATLRRRANVVIVASRFETFPNTLLEAMVTGCPVASSNVGGVNEILQHERNGLIFQAGNAESLALACKRLLEAPEFAARIAHQAGEDCNLKFNPETIASETAAFHQEVIARHRHAMLR